MIEIFAEGWEEKRYGRERVLLLSFIGMMDWSVGDVLTEVGLMCAVCCCWNVCREILYVVCGEKERCFECVRDLWHDFDVFCTEILTVESGWNGQSVRRDVLEQEKCCLRTGKVARVGNRRWCVRLVGFVWKEEKFCRKSGLRVIWTRILQVIGGWVVWLGGGLCWTSEKC